MAPASGFTNEALSGNRTGSRRATEEGGGAVRVCELLHQQLTVPAFSTCIIGLVRCYFSVCTTLVLDQLWPQCCLSLFTLHDSVCLSWLFLPIGPILCVCVVVNDSKYIGHNI